jgi:hypothetical protein
MGAVALQKWGKEHPEQVRQNAVRALGVARQVTTARAQKARELQQEQKARAHLPRGFPSRSSRVKQLAWLRNEYLKMGTESVAPAAWRWRALKGALLCVRQLPADSGESQRNAHAAQLAFERRQLAERDATIAQLQQELREAEQRNRQPVAEPAAAQPVAIEQSPKAEAPATGPAAGVASPLEFYVRADAEGAVYFGRDYDSCCRAPARRVTQSPQPMAIL